MQAVNTSKLIQENSRKAWIVFSLGISGQPPPTLFTTSLPFFCPLLAPYSGIRVLSRLCVVGWGSAPARHSNTPVPAGIIHFPLSSLISPPEVGSPFYRPLKCRCLIWSLPSYPAVRPGRYWEPSVHLFNVTLVSRLSNTDLF